MQTAYERPDYAVKPLEARIAAILASHKTESAERLKVQWEHATREELLSLRRYADGKCSSIPFWPLEGKRRITDAYERAYRLATFRETLARQDIAYVRAGRDFVPNTWLVYARDAASPTGVHHVGSMQRCPESDALVDAARACTLSPTESP